MLQRRKTSVVNIDTLSMGGEHPIRIQSMTNTSTLDTEGSIQQVVRIIEAGGELVRLTAQGVREAENLQAIRDGLHALGYHTPLVADIHFNPKAAEAAARIVEKVRINPGNFADPVKTFKTFEYTEEEYQQEIDKIKERFIPFLNTCKEHRTAIRIGVNHGSLSDRIMSRYGDTPQGMVESCMEFLRICVAEHFPHVVISMKASNTFTMVQTVRLLVKQMDQEDMHFPLHLGVTEAGDGEDGRIKSAVGIGTLLLEGIGDTIRVSLSEDPEAEIPVARALVEHTIRRRQNAPAAGIAKIALCKPTLAPHSATPIVISDRSQTTDISVDENLMPDYLYTKQSSFKPLSLNDINEEALTDIRKHPETMLLLFSEDNNVYEQKACIAALRQAEITNRIVLWNTYDETDLATFQIKAATDCGSFFLDRWADGLMLSNAHQQHPPQAIDACSFGILQATGRRISKTEYISCPSCGRTLFDLQTVIKKVKAATSHLKGLKIAIMGCIVNGPGEMADADYGYVGAGIGKVSLYKGKQCVLKNIPEATAVDELMKIISNSQ
ncbi:MAG: 4-hydroxy-3-methylbut-2-en-1-yl diphosphate synthase (ferredoxin) [Candidatus Ordinivivax streblomastigis]|uniref:4-hydroxy-3-methylbut-2-en-1-yl diphosphate synthase (flavodoxin) n=1 Tax=Candidatus Ordinivivax streblomastigis TaxID=2540710 RepID=A0A5M8P5N5_9BACT|nr:MAG: 4-hydroxy-3-methylbut-2-en-1-yl diphosphate synthase (ferredoxin) [Candidatus Ordinivivax streblomastigis]